MCRVYNLRIFPSTSIIGSGKSDRPPLLRPWTRWTGTQKSNDLKFVGGTHSTPLVFVTFSSPKKDGSSSGERDWESGEKLVR